MNTVSLDGNEYILRCDLNVVEEIENQYGSFGDMKAKLSAPATIKFLLAAMINEHYYFIDSPERVTERWIGAHIMEGERVAVMTAIITEINRCIMPKNA